MNTTKSIFFTMGFVKLDPYVVTNIKRCLWGISELKQDVFSRWSQGFVFSESTPTALIQYQGGPCAVLVPVQAYIIKAALCHCDSQDPRVLLNVISERAKDLLLEALLDILVQMTDTNEFVLVGCQSSSDETANGSAESRLEETDSIQNTTADHPLSDRNEDSFHSSLTVHRCSRISDVREILSKLIPSLQSPFGVLLYLYSIVLTKGIEQIKNEVEDPSEPLIDGTYGHGSQSLINLLLTSTATSNVWDNDKEIDGLKLRGIQRQSTIGFLTILEQMRYCEVGWYFKNPKYPVWVLGSETHLTLLFSSASSLVISDSPEMTANSIFARFDPEGNGFIATSLLGDLMAALDLVSEKEYVDIMATKLDSEGFGIITRSSFMDEFFPTQSTEQQTKFTLYHYNGLPQSCIGGKHFLECKATLADEVEMQFITDTSPIKLCLQTKWPSVELSWENNVPPSLN